jgi:hypothetical protein
VLATRLSSTPSPLLSRDSQEGCVLRESSSAGRSPSVPQGLFGVSQEDRLFVLAIHSGTPRYVSIIGHVCIPGQTLQRHILRMTQVMQQSRQSLSIPWMDWGPDGSRLSFNEQLDPTWVHVAYGSRVVTFAVHSTQGGVDGPGNYNIRIILRDFSPLAVRKIITADVCPNDTSPGTSWARSTSWEVCNQPEDVDWFKSLHSRGYKVVSSSFEDDVSTRLLIFTPLEHRGGHSVMLTENKILVVHEGDVRVSIISGHAS